MDDGPSSYTSTLLDILDSHEVKASFFLLGQQIDAFPDLKDRMLHDGHFIGNHGDEHLSGWGTSLEQYTVNLELGKLKSGSSCYRPPYGRMRPGQWKEVTKENSIIMWDVMPGDFDSSIRDQMVIDRAVNGSRPGSIIVMHDNEKTAPRLLSILPRIIIGLKEKGLRLEALDQKNLQV